MTGWCIMCRLSAICLMCDNFYEFFEANQVTLDIGYVQPKWQVGVLGWGCMSLAGCVTPFMNHLRQITWHTHPKWRVGVSHGGCMPLVGCVTPFMNHLRQITWQRVWDTCTLSDLLVYHTEAACHLPDVWHLLWTIWGKSRESGHWTHGS